MRHRLPWTWLVASLFALALGAGCARGDDLDLDADVGLSDATHSDGRFDAPDTSTPCRSSAECTSPSAPVCDPALRRCVECVTSPDTCGAGRYCEFATRSCKPGCRASADCARADAGTAGDGGSGGAFCLLSEHRCVECLLNDHCADGLVCTDNACVPGCTATRPCAEGRTCCPGARGGMCLDLQSSSQACGACGNVCAEGSACCGGQCTDIQGETANCGGCGVVCQPAHGMGRCEAGACGIATCDPGFADFDGVAENGCECAVGTGGASCTTAFDLGTLAGGAMREVNGVLRMPGEERWYRVGLTSTGQPDLRLTTNPGGSVRFEVRTACTATALSCPDRGEGATGIDTWEMRDTPGTHTSRDTPIPGSVLVRVYTTAPIEGCSPFALTARN
jgi:hypothetical protein